MTPFTVFPLLTLATVSWATMVDIPDGVSPMAVLMAFIWAAFGGLANALHRINSSAGRRSFVLDLATDLVYAGFSGITAFFMCLAYDVPLWQTAVIVGISGHSGTRFVRALERTYMRLLSEKTES